MKNEKGKLKFLGIILLFIYFLQNRTIYEIFNVETFQIYAQQSVQYSYDSLGRVLTATYPDGTVVKYEYDKNGNMLSGKLQDKSLQDNPGETGGSGTGNKGQGTTGGSGTVTPGQGTTGGSGTGETSLDVQQPVVSTVHNSAQEIKIYNAFKKKKPVIKSLKEKKDKKKIYLNIQIRKVGKNSSEMETGYQIQYATNNKFKKPKKIKIEKKKGKSVTSKKWKVKKNKTYYVRVRAYMKTRTGKIIYTKYSKTKKISV